MSIYISGSCCISPQLTFNQNWPPTEINQAHEFHLPAIEPQYAAYIPPLLIRRMKKVIKMSVACAFETLKTSQIEMPDAIIVATGMGCFDDSCRFLEQLIDNEGGLLPPTNFIQSTHNSISSQIALMRQCHGYNMTYVHKGISFESALTDAMLMLSENPELNILTGGADENTVVYTELLTHAGYLKEGTRHFLEDEHQGYIQGEGSAFFMVTGADHESCFAKIDDVGTFSFPESEHEIIKNAQLFLQKNKISIENIDLCMLGFSGDAILDFKLKQVSSSYLKSVPKIIYKNICGEYFTASSFALWVASQILKTKQIPSYLCIEEQKSGSARNILIINHYRDSNYSFLLVSSC